MQYAVDSTSMTSLEDSPTPDLPIAPAANAAAREELFMVLT